MDLRVVWDTAAGIKTPLAEWVSSIVSVRLNEPGHLVFDPCDQAPGVFHATFWHPSDGRGSTRPGIIGRKFRPKKVKHPMRAPVAQTPITDQMREAADSEIVEQGRKVEYYLNEYTIELLAMKMRNGDFQIPAYQREFTWEPKRKSRFIESLIIGLQIPFLFFWEMPDGNLEIVDGSQRLRTIEEFVLGALRLTELEWLPKLSDFSFSDLPETRQKKIRNRSIRGIVLNEHADEQTRFEMFNRINTGSKIPNKAEVRRGALGGPFMSLIVELARDHDFVALAPMSEDQTKEREHEELVIRFFAYTDGLDGYRDRVSEFIFNYAKRMNAVFEEDPSLEAAYRVRFTEMVSFVTDIYPFGFRRRATTNATPRARFEAIAIGSHLAMQERPQLRTNRPDVLRWIVSDPFTAITGADGANAIARLRGRIGFVKDRLLEG